MTTAVAARPCPGCGYDLRAHARTARCPECDAPFLSGTVELFGQENPRSGLSPTATILMMMVSTVFLFAMVVFVMKGASPEVWVFYALISVSMTAWTLRTYRRQSATHSLILDPTGITLKHLQSGATFIQPWTQGHRLEISTLKASFFLTDDPPALVRLLDRTNESVLRFTTQLSDGQSGAVAAQALEWARAAKDPNDPLEPYRSCIDCLKPGCHCKDKARDIILIPMFSWGYDPERKLLPAQLQLFLYSILFSHRKPGLFLTWCILTGLIFTAAAMFRAHRHRPTHEARFGPGGYQFTTPLSPLNLRPWRGRAIESTQRSFMRPAIGISTRFVNFVPFHRFLLLSEDGLRQLHRQHEKWLRPDPTRNRFHMN